MVLGPFRVVDSEMTDGFDSYDVIPLDFYHATRCGLTTKGTIYLYLYLSKSVLSSSHSRYYCHHKLSSTVAQLPSSESEIPMAFTRLRPFLRATTIREVKGVIWFRLELD